MSIEFLKFFGKYIEKEKKDTYNVCVIEKGSEKSDV